MGWYPTHPMYSHFPGKPIEGKNEFPRFSPCFGGWIKRGSKVGKGTAKHKHPNMGSEQRGRPRHYTALLVENARARGWVNGKPIGKGKPH